MPSLCWLPRPSLSLSLSHSTYTAQPMPNTSLSASPSNIDSHQTQANPSRTHIDQWYLHQLSTLVIVSATGIGQILTQGEWKMCWVRNEISQGNEKMGWVSNIISSKGNEKIGWYPPRGMKNVVGKQWNIPHVLGEKWNIGEWKIPWVRNEISPQGNEKCTG